MASTSRQPRRQLRALAISVIVGGSIGAGATIADINPAAAFAADYLYCGQLVPAQTECPDKVYSMPAQGNRATYPGSGTVSVTR